MLSELLQVTFKSDIMNIIVTQVKIDFRFHITKCRLSCVVCLSIFLRHSKSLDVKHTVSQVEKWVRCLHNIRLGCGKFERPRNLIVTFDGATVVSNLKMLGAATFFFTVENHAFALVRWQIV